MTANRFLISMSQKKLMYTSKPNYPLYLHIHNHKHKVYRHDIDLYQALRMGLGLMYLVQLQYVDLYRVLRMGRR